MKSIIKYVLLIASFSLLTTSCKKEEEVTPKSEGEKTGEILKKYSSNITRVYQNGELLVSDFNFIIDKQYLILPNNNGNYYKFDLNKLIYYKTFDGIITLSF
jgi:hypothetical protein